MKLSIIMPVYNEKHTSEEIIRRVSAVEGIEKELIIVDDFSTDGTRELLRKYQKNCNIKIIFHDKNMGKGMAIRTGLKKVTGDMVIIQDADLEYDPNDYLKLIKPIIEDGADVVYGSRSLSHKNKMSYLRYFIGGKMVTWWANLLYWCWLTDEPTCYKLFRSDILKSLRLKCKRFEFCPEVTAKIRKRGIKIVEVPISYQPRKMEEGKKIRWKDGLQALWTLLRYRFKD
jgi:glycosyltransferase involved in cell wall biosynthesis